MQETPTQTEILATPPKHIYDYAVDATADTAPARVVRMIGNDKRVLEVGSGPGAITKQLKVLGACAVTALEIDPVSIELVRPYCEAVYSADLNSPNWGELLGGEKFDVVLAADVLEHVYKPLDVLKSMASLVSVGGRVVLSLPHVGHCALVSCLLLEDFDYREWGLLDKTHIRFFGIKNIQDLVKNAGLCITRAEFVVRHPEETEFSTKWTSLSHAAKLALLENRHGFVYQVVLEAKLADSSDVSLNLMELQAVHGKLGLKRPASLSLIEVGRSGIRARIVQLLPPNAKAGIRKLAKRMGVSI